VDDCIIQEMRALLNRHSALAALLLPVTRETALKILKLRAQHSAREGEGRPAKSQDSRIPNHVVLAQAALAMEALRNAPTSSPVISDDHPEEALVPRPGRIAV